VRELPDGNILNVIIVFPEDFPEDPSSSIWVIANRDGEILARTSIEIAYSVWNDTPDGHYLASYWDYEALEPVVARLEVTIGPA